MPDVPKEIIGYKFFIHRGMFGYSRRPGLIYRQAIEDALARFIELALHTNIPAYHLGIRTVNRRRNVKGRRAIVTGEMLQLRFHGKLIRFKIEPLYGDDND